MALANELNPKSAVDRDWSVRTFFASQTLRALDYPDETDQPLFDRALAKLGPLAPDEMYGFEPALVAGGKPRLEFLHRVKLDQHLTLLRQLAAPSLPLSGMDLDKLIKR